MNAARVARSLSSEWRKMLSTKLWWILAIILAAYAAMVAAMFAFMFGAMGDMLAEQGLAAMPAQEAADMVYSSVTSFAYVVPLLLGALTATGELRHGTLGLTFTLEPRRGIVLFSKSAVLLVFGLVLGVAGLVGAVGTGAGILAASGSETMLGTGDTWALIARALAALGIWAVIGFGIGVLVRNQAFAIVLALVFTQFVEPILRMGAQFWEWSAEVAKYLPGAATDAFVGASAMTGLVGTDPSMPDGGASEFGVCAGFAVLAAYAVVAIAAGWLLRWRRDVT